MTTRTIVMYAFAALLAGGLVVVSLLSASGPVFAPTEAWTEPAGEALTGVVMLAWAGAAVTAVMVARSAVMLARSLARASRARAARASRGRPMRPGRE